MAVCAFSLSTGQAEAGGSLWDGGQATLDSEFQNSQDYVEWPCLKKTKILEAMVHSIARVFNAAELYFKRVNFMWYDFHFNKQNKQAKNVATHYLIE